MPRDAPAQGCGAPGRLRVSPAASSGRGARHGDPKVDRVRPGLRCALALLCVAACGALAAPLPETPRVRLLGVDDGLPSNAIYQVAQDRAGYLWLASGDGLARFDGVHTRIWRHDPGDPGSIPGNLVQALHVDARDRVWFAAEDAGLAVLDPGRGTVQRVAPTVSGGDVWAITSDASGDLWFGGYGGGLRRLAGGETGQPPTVWRHAPGDASSLSSDIVLSLAIGRDGAVYVGTVRGLDRMQQGAFERVPGVPAGTVLALHAASDGTVFIGTGEGLYRRTPEGRVARIGRPGEHAAHGVMSLHQDRRGSLWIGGRRGLLRHHHERMDDLSPAFVPAPGALPVAVLGIHEDHEGGIWFGSRGVGLARLSPTWRNFAVLPAPGNVTAPAALATASEDLDGTLWLAGDAGLARLPADAAQPEWIARGDAFAGRRQTAVLPLADAVWVGHVDGLSRFDRRLGTIRHFGVDGEDPVPRGMLDLLAPDGSGGLWLSVYGAGLQRRDAAGRVLQSVTAGDASGLASNDVEQLGAGPDGALWLATGKGLLRRDPASGRFASPPGAPTGRVHAFAFAGARQVWVHGTRGLYRYRLDPDGLVEEHAAPAGRAVPAVAAGGLAVDAGGNVWLSTQRGLFRYQPAAGSLRQFGVRDGLPSIDFSDRPLLQARDGRIVADTQGGMVLFDPMSLEQLATPPRLVLDAIRVRRAGARITLAGAVAEVQPGDQELEVSAQLLSFADPGGHRYRSRLEGLDTDWVEQGAEGVRRFGRLEPGRYVLHIAAANADGVWAEPALRQELRVLPPWWRTPLAVSAWALLAGLLLLLAARGYRARLARAHRRQLAEQQREWALRASEAKTEFLATMGHEVRTPMTGVLGMAELLLEADLPPAQRRHVEGIRQSGELMLRVVDDALDLARIEAGRLELHDELLSPAALLEAVAAVVEPLARRKGLAFTVEVAADTPARVRGDPLRLRQVLLNLAGNAVKFTTHGGVRLCAAGADPPHTLCLSVVDSGPGLSDAEQARLFRRFGQASAATAQRHGGSGLGLAISSELAQLMGGEIRLHSAPGQGTRFDVLLPLVAAAADASAEAPAAGPAPVAAAPRPRHILLVEDDATVARVLAELLQRRGHAVRHVPHGLAALAEWQPGRFDLALLDLDLPGVDGATLAQMLRQRGADVPLLAITARADPRAEHEARAAGMDGFLRKPIPSAALFAAVEAAAVREVVD